MRGRAFAFAESRMHQFKEARTHCRTGNGIAFIETKNVQAVRFDTNYSFVHQFVSEYDFDQIEWNRGKLYTWDASNVLTITDGGSGPNLESGLYRQTFSGLQVMRAQRSIIRGFATKWMLNLYFVNSDPPFRTDSFGGWVEFPYPGVYSVPIPGAPNFNTGDQGSNRFLLGDITPGQIESGGIDLIGWP
jgi:hypothetical protein